MKAGVAIQIADKMDFKITTKKMLLDIMKDIL